MHHSKISFPDCRKIHFRETYILKISQGSMPPDPPRGSGIQPSILQVPAHSQGSALLLQKLMKTETGLLELEVEGGE